MNFINFIVFYIFFILFNTSTCIFIKNKFGKSLPISVMLVSFSMYISQMIFKTFNVGFILSILYCFYSVIYIFINIKDKNKMDKVKNYVFSSGFYVFLVITAVLMIFDWNRTFTRWDEFSHWGEMLKEMLRLDKFYCINASVLQVHKEYPPMLQLFELFIIKLFGSYKESSAIFSLHFIEISLLLSFIPENIDVKKKKNILLTFVSMILIFLITLFFDQHGIINSIYNDYFMACLVAYSMLIIILNNKILSNYVYISLMLSLSFLLLTKQIAITLYSMIIFFYLFKLIINKEKETIRKNDCIKIFISLIIIPILFMLSWNIYVKQFNIDPQFKLSDIKIQESYKIARGRTGNQTQIKAASNFIGAVKGRNITTNNIQLTYINAVLLGMLLIYCISLKYRKSIEKKDLIALLLTLAIGSIGYAFVMFITYIFCFKGIEATNIASYERYMSTYILIIFYIFSVLLIYFVYKNKDFKMLIIITAFLFIFSSVGRFDDILPRIRRGYSNMYSENADVIRNKIRGNKKIFIVSQNTSGECQYFTKYYANPIYVNLKNYSWKNSNYEDYYNSIKKSIKKYDYIYFEIIDDDFSKNYEFAFNTKVKQGELYKIIKKYDEIKYELVR